MCALVKISAAMINTSIRNRHSGRSSSPNLSVEVGTHPEVVVVRRRPVTERRAPQPAQRLPFPKIGHLDPGFEEGASSVGLPSAQQGAYPLQDHSAVRGNLFRRRVDHHETAGGLTRGQQMVGGLDQQRQAGRRLSDGAGIQFRGAHVIAPCTGEQGQPADRPRRRPELVGAQVAEPRCLEVSAGVRPEWRSSVDPTSPPLHGRARRPASRDRWHQAHPLPRQSWSTSPVRASATR